MKGAVTMDFRTLHLLFRYGREYGHSHIRNSGLSDTGHIICTFLYAHPECSQEDIVQATRIDKTTVAKSLRVLEEKGLITRTQSQEDRRRNVLQITENGKESISDILRVNDQWMEGILSCLSPEEQQQFESYCSRLLDAAEQMSNHRKD